jgi:WD40 repeat protein
MLRLREAPRENSHGHGGEVFALAFTPDGTHVLSGGWDGRLSLWDVETGEAVAGLSTGAKPVSACAVSPDGKQWLSGTLEGVLGFWDAGDHHSLRKQVAHTRPISSIRFSEDRKTLVTASWDRRITLWNLEKDRETTPLAGHDDIVSGCCFTPDGSKLVSWSHDATIRFWQVSPPLDVSTLRGHRDRVTAAALSPDGRWLVSGSRDGEIKLWDLTTQQPVATGQTSAEVKALAFFLDGESLLSVDLAGRLALYGLPDLRGVESLATALAVHCAELDPSNSRVVLGCGDGRVRFVDVEGFEEAPLLVTPTRRARRTTTTLQRLFGGHTVKTAYEVTCPACRRSFDMPRATPGQAAACPSCRRALRVNNVTRVGTEKAV